MTRKNNSLTLMFLCAIALSMAITIPAYADDALITTDRAESLSVSSLQSSGYYYTQDEISGELTIIDYAPGITELIIPESIDGHPVVAIGEKAFYQCKTLRSITLPASVKTIGIQAFYECTDLETVHLSNGLVSIDDEAFYSCKSLTQINLPDSLTSIGKYSFFECESMTKIVLPNAMESIAFGAFWLCESLESIQLPSSLKEIGSHAFYCCKALQTIDLPDTLTNIERGAFSTCTSLNHIIWPAGVTTIHDNMFYNCYSLTDITLPTGITYIGYWAFSGCRSLETLILPDPITKFDEEVFQHCPNLTLIGHAGSHAETYANSYDIPFIPLWDNPFTDVAKNDWFYTAVEYVNQNSLMYGLSDSKFGPDMSLTRAQFATILYRIHDKPPVEYRATFSDVPDNTWYSDPVIWANQVKVIYGYPNGLFGTNDNITREQMAVMMYRYTKNVLHYDAEPSGNLTAFHDVSQISSYAKDAFQWAVGIGLICGKPGDFLDPQGPATRAECASIIMRFTKYYSE